MNILVKLASGKTQLIEAEGARLLRETRGS